MTRIRPGPSGELRRTHSLVRFAPASELSVTTLAAFLDHHGDSQLWARNEVALTDSLRDRRILGTLLDPRFMDSMSGCCLSEVTDERAVPLWDDAGAFRRRGAGVIAVGSIEIAATAIVRPFRSFGLAETVASAALMNELSEIAEVEAIFTSRRPCNEPCGRANARFGTREITTAQALGYGGSLRQTILERMSVYAANSWEHGPTVALIMPDGIRKAAQIFLECASRTGHLLDNGDVVQLGSGWPTKDDDAGFWPFVLSCSRGWTPRVRVWSEGGTHRRGLASA